MSVNAQQVSVKSSNCYQNEDIYQFTRKPLVALNKLHNENEPTYISQDIIPELQAVFI